MIIPFFLHPTPCYLILQWHSPCAKKTKKACLLGCTQQIVTKLKLLLKEGKKEPMHVFCSHSKPGIFPRYHLSGIFFTFQIHKASQPTHPPALQMFSIEQNESTAHMLQSQLPPSPGRRCSFNARISHGVKYPHQLLRLQTPPHKIHNLQLLQAQGGRGEGEKGKLYQIGVERVAVKAGTSSRRILRW